MFHQRQQHIIPGTCFPKFSVAVLAQDSWPLWLGRALGTLSPGHRKPGRLFCRPRPAGDPARCTPTAPQHGARMCPLFERTRPQLQRSFFMWRSPGALVTHPSGGRLLCYVRACEPFFPPVDSTMFGISATIVCVASTTRRKTAQQHQGRHRQKDI